MVEYFKMGVITSPHGIQGEVKVFPTTDNVQHFKNISDCYLKKGKEYKPARITGSLAASTLPLSWVSSTSVPSSPVMP